MIFYYFYPFFITLIIYFFIEFNYETDCENTLLLENDQNIFIDTINRDIFMKISFSNEPKIKTLNNILKFYRFRNDSVRFCIHFHLFLTEIQNVT